MTTKTLDERLRDRARRVLGAEIEGLLAPLTERIGPHCFDNTGILHPEGHCWTDTKRSLTFQQLVDLVKMQAIQMLTLDAEEKAVAEFLAKVDNLQAQLDELQSVVENQE